MKGVSLGKEGGVGCTDEKLVHVHILAMCHQPPVYDYLMPCRSHVRTVVGSRCLEHRRLIESSGLL